MKNWLVLLLCSAFFSACTSTPNHPIALELCSRYSLPVHGFHCSSEGAILLQSADNLVQVPEYEQLLAKPQKNILAVTRISGKPAVLTDQQLYTVEDGELRSLLEFTLSKPLISCHGSRAYISGVTEDAKSVLYVYEEKLGHQALLQAARPITALTSTADGRAVFASGMNLFLVEPGKEVVTLAALPNLKTISHLAVTPDLKLIFFSDGEATYALADRGRVLLLMSNAGGPLEFHGSSLYLLRLQAHSLLKIDELEESIFQENSSVVELSR